MNFVNFWMRDIVLPLGAAACPLDLPDGEYRLVIADGVGEQATAREIIDAVVAGGTGTLTRGLEGTADQDWPVGSVIYSSVTAGILQALAGGGTGDDTVVESITTDVHTRFFGKPSTPPSRVGQVCRQIDVNGQVCEWVAYVFWDATLQWRRSVLPMADWGTGVPDTYATALASTDRAFAMTKGSSVSTPIVTTLELPELVASDGVDLLEHGPLPLVMANWSTQTWTVNLDPAAFWESGGQVELELSGLDLLGITTSTSGPDGSVVSFVVPANMHAWVDVMVETYMDEGVFTMYLQLVARRLNLYLI